MTRHMRLALLAALALVQLGAAAWSIVRYESVLASGTLYKIRTAAFDPADAFRGRFVAVRPSIALPEPIDPEVRQLLHSFRQDGRKVFVELAADDQGFARAARILVEPPSGDYLEVHHAWPQWDAVPTQQGQQAFRGFNLTFSFDRYYMNEAAAPAADRRFAEASRRREAATWLTVRVKNGTGVIEGLFVDGVPIEQAIGSSR